MSHAALRAWHGRQQTSELNVCTRTYSQSVGGSMYMYVRLCRNEARGHISLAIFSPLPVDSGT